MEAHNSQRYIDIHALFEDYKHMKMNQGIVVVTKTVYVIASNCRPLNHGDRETAVNHSPPFPDLETNERKHL